MRLGTLSRLGLALAALLAGSGVSFGAAYYQVVPDLTTLESYGASSPLIAEAIVTNAGGGSPNSSLFTWLTGSCTADGVTYFAATGVSTSVGCWKRSALEVAASSTAGAGLIVPEGPAPTGSVTNGSVWIVSGQGLYYELDGSPVGPFGTGTVSVTGSPSTGEIAKFSGASSLTNGNLSGDCTTTNTLAITCTKTNGVVFAASATTDATNASNINTGTLNVARLAADVGLTDHNQTWVAQAGAAETMSLSGANITPDFNDYVVHGVTLVHASCPCTLQNPTGTLTDGKAGFIRLTQSATGSDAVSLGTDYIYPGGHSAFPVLSGTAASENDGFSYQIDDLGFVWLSVGALNAH